MISRNKTSDRNSEASISLSPKQPRYIWLRDCLLKDIEQGKYAIGSSFPTEEQLAAQYQVSRHTVREATRQLVQSGLISRRRSTGTVVTATQQHEPYVAALGTLQELMQYTYTTRLEVISKESVTMDDGLATLLGGELGSRWLLLHSHRHRLDDIRPISYTMVYLRPEFAEIADHLKGKHPSIFKLHEMLFNRPVASVVQKIDAALLPAPAAQQLGISPSTPTLKMTRSYLDSDGRVMSASINYYPPYRFQLVTRWDRGRDEPNIL